MGQLDFLCSLEEIMKILVASSEYRTRNKEFRIINYGAVRFSVQSPRSTEDTGRQ